MKHSSLIVYHLALSRNFKINKTNIVEPILFYYDLKIRNHYSVIKN